MKQKIKEYVKKVIKWDENMEPGSYDEQNFSLSLKEYTISNPDTLCEHRSIGVRHDRKDFSPAIKEIGEAFDYFSRDIHKFADSNVKNRTEYDNFQSGTPIPNKPFKPCLKSVKKSLNNKKLYMYPTGTGNARSKKKFLEYLLREGFQKDKTENYDGLSIDNIAFTVSVSQAYAMIVKLIARPEDVIILTGPNYGLFAIEADRYDARVEILDLKEEDNWFVNSDELAKKIDTVNKRLKKKFAGKLNYTPKVVAFLNINPHNPIGNVMNKKNIKLLNAIGDVCLEKGVFVIDDLIYRDLGYDRDNLATPMASNPKYFNNTISFFGISKAYSLASFRAGAVVAPIPIIRKISDLTYQTVLCTPSLQVDACIGAFNGSDKRYKEYNKYFKDLMTKYYDNYNIFRAMLYGIDSLDKFLLDSKFSKLNIQSYKYKIEKKIRFELSGREHTDDVLKDGIKGVSIRKGTDPESGFFIVLDFTKFKGKKNGDITINNDKDLLKYLYTKGKVEFIMGSSMSWPNKDEIIARVSFSLTEEALIDVMYIIHKAMKELK